MHSCECNEIAIKFHNNFCLASFNYYLPAEKLNLFSNKQVYAFLQAQKTKKKEFLLLELFTGIIQMGFSLLVMITFSFCFQCAFSATCSRAWKICIGERNNTTSCRLLKSPLRHWWWKNWECGKTEKEIKFMQTFST